MKNMFRENVKAKLICILFAFMMWIYVMSYDNPVITSEHREIPVTISNMKDIKAAELVLAPDTKLTTKVVLKGRRKNVLEAERDGFKAQGIISEPKEGSNVLKLELNMENTYVNYSLSPHTISVVLERDVLEQKPVVVDTQGSLIPSLRIEKMQTNPSNIYVGGPKSLVDKTVALRVSMDITGNTKDFSKKLQVTPVDKEGNIVEGLKLNEESVFIHATVVESKKVPVQLKVVGKEEGDERLSGYTITPSEIEISGPSEIVGVVSEVFTEEININELLKQSKYLSGLALPDKLQSSTKEVTISVSSEKLMVKEFEISKDKLTVRGGQLQDFSENNKIPDRIRVKVVFSGEAGNIITEDDISLYVEMKDVEKNPANVPIKAEIKKTYETIEITPVDIDLEGQ